MVAPLGGPRLPAAGARRLRAAAGAGRRARAGRDGRRGGALAELRRCASRCCSRARSSSASASAWSRRRRFAPPRSPAASATRCAAPTSPRSWSRPPRSAPARSASCTCCWRRSSSCRSAASRGWSRRCCPATATLPIGGGLGEPAARRAALVVVAASAKLIASGLALAAPVVVALWLTDLALGPDRARRAVGAGVLPGPTSQGAAGDRRRPPRARDVTKRPRRRFRWLVQAVCAER